MAKLNNYRKGNEHQAGKPPQSVLNGLPTYPSPAPKWINESIARSRWR